MPKKKTPRPEGVRIVKIGGEDRPIRFGTNAMATFNRLTDTSLAEAQRKFNPPPEVQAQIQAAREAGKEPEVEWESPLQAGEIIAFCFAALQDGARKRKIDFPFDIYDVGDWLDDVDDPEVMQQFFGAQADAHDAGSDPDAEADEAEGNAPKKGKKK